MTLPADQLAALNAFRDTQSTPSAQTAQQFFAPKGVVVTIPHGLMRTLRWSMHASVIGVSVAIGKEWSKPIYIDRETVKTIYLTNTVEVCRYPGKELEKLGVKPTR